MKLTARRKCSFGNGTRKPGFEFGTFEINDGVTPYEFEKELILPKPFADLKTGSVKLAEGVKEREFSMAFRNGTATLRAGGEEKVEPVDYKTILIDETGLSDSIKKALGSAELKTLGDVESYANDNEGLQSISGIGEASESEVIDLLSQHVNK